MTSLAILKRKLQKIEEKQLSEENDPIVVMLWMPDSNCEINHGSFILKPLVKPLKGENGNEADN